MLLIEVDRGHVCPCIENISRDLCLVNLIDGAPGSLGSFPGLDL